MADIIPNTYKTCPEAPATVVSVLVLFGAFLATLPKMIADERDLGGYSGQDPAVDAWITAADASLAVSKTACAMVLAAHTTGAPIDGPNRALIRVAQLFHKVMDSAHPEEVARLRAHAGLRRWAWLVPSSGWRWTMSLTRARPIGPTGPITARTMMVRVTTAAALPPRRPKLNFHPVLRPFRRGSSRARSPLLSDEEHPHAQNPDPLCTQEVPPCYPWNSL
jgi:hypothetical protein